MPGTDLESAVEISPPPNTWLRQPGLLIAVAVGLIAVVAGVLVVLTPWSDFMRGLVGGALLGLGGVMVVGAPFSAREAWEQHRRDYRVWRRTKDNTDRLIAESLAQITDPFYLGVDSRMLTANEEDIPVRLERAMQRCAISGISFSDEENKLLDLSNPTLKEAAQISDLITQKAQQRGRKEWTYFRLGQLIGSIVPNLESSRPIQPITRQLERIQRNQSIRLEMPFGAVVINLLGDLSGFDETASGTPRRMAIGRVVKILSGLPSPEIETYGQELEQFLVMEDEWYWTQDESGSGIPVCFSAGYTITAQGAWDYAISKDSSEYQTQVKRPHVTWDCSAHAEANGNSPCFDIQLIFDHTNGGMPVTEARKILVRSGEPEVLEPE